MRHNARIRQSDCLSIPPRRHGDCGCAVCADGPQRATARHRRCQHSRIGHLPIVQFEQRHFHRRNERDIVPACNFLFDAEVGVGMLQVSPESAPRIDIIALQFKKAIVSATPGEWGLGISGASILASRNGNGVRQNQLTALITRQFEVSALHLNLGTVHDREAAAIPRNRLTWGVAGEYQANPRLTRVGEAFGQRGMPATAQIGLRWWAVTDHIQFTASTGAPRGEGREGRWVSFGIRLETGNALLR